MSICQEKNYISRKNIDALHEITSDRKGPTRYLGEDKVIKIRFTCDGK